MPVFEDYGGNLYQAAVATSPNDQVVVNPTAALVTALTAVSPSPRRVTVDRNGVLVLNTATYDTGGLIARFTSDSSGITGLAGSGINGLATIGQGVGAKVASAVQTQAAATQLGWGYNLCTGNIADTLKLPAATGTGRAVQVFSNTAYFLTVYPQIGEQISSFGANAAYAVFVNQIATFVDQAIGQWQIATNLPIFYPTYTLTAFATGGQANATQAGYSCNIVNVCATLNDSIKLPIAIGSLSPLFVVNYGVAGCRIFPTTGTRLNNVVNGTFDLAAGKTALFLDTGPTPNNTWSGGLLA